MLPFRHAPCLPRTDLQLVTTVTSPARMTMLETNAGATAGLLLISGSLVVAVLLRAGRRAAGATLSAPLLWGAFSVLAVCGVELTALATGKEHAANWLPSARFIAAAATLCPAIALLGAKRPQSRAWQFIVLTLLGILAQPAINALLFRYGDPVSLHAARRWFMAALLLMGVVNYLPTRFALSAGLVGASQVLLLWGFLPFTEPSADSLHDSQRVCLALTLCAAACLPPLFGWPRPRAGTTAWDRLWIDFRNAYGIVWALRVEERVNTPLAATSSVRLGWNGFESATPEIASAQAGAAQAIEKSESVTQTESDEEIAARPALVALLRRFVSKEWIAARLNG